VIWPDDHNPPHIHIFKGGTELIIELGVGDTEPRIRNVYRMTNRDIAAAFAITRANNDGLLKRWREIMG
jgi:hypothetical protein